MRCLVTGGAGFVGGHLARRLRQQGHETVVFDSLAHPADGEDWREATQFLRGDVRDPSALAAACADAEVVFHLAATGERAGADLLDVFHTNVTGTINVLRAAASAGARRLVFASSCEVYGAPPTLPVAEAQPALPRHADGASKAAAEAYCRTLGNCDDLSTVVLRLTTVYGPGGHALLIPAWLRKARLGQDVVVFGGQQLLDFIWVDVVVDALIAAARPEVAPTTINVGSGVGCRLADVAARVVETVRSSSRVVLRAAPAGDVQRFVADVRRMTDTLGVPAPFDPLAGIPALARSEGVRPGRAAARLAAAR